jgi:AcrR family transcriptional regulator
MEGQNKREAQRLQRRQQILECALDRIVEGGFTAMRIRDIAEKLGISTGLFFNYFESKEQVYEELVKIGLSGPRMVMGLNDGGLQPIGLFEKMAETILDALQRDAFTGKVFLLMAHATRSSDAPEGVKALLRDFDPVSPLVDVVRNGQALGQIKRGDPAALLAAYWGAVQGIAENYAVSGGFPCPEASWIADILRARPEA